MESTITNRSVIDIYLKVKFLRSHEGMNLKDLSEALKLHRERIMNLESGNYKADLQDVIRYCDYFGLDYESFLFDKFEKFKTDCEADAAKLSKALFKTSKNNERR